MALYAANLYINEYLKGKDLSPISSDNRYYYYEEGEALTTALSLMPAWYYIYFAPAWA